MKDLLHRINWILVTQLGFNWRSFYDSIIGIPHYLKDYWEFRRQYSGRIYFFPCLGDRFKEAGCVGDEYFWQDLEVARQVHLENPKRHVDIGSSINGFIAHLACFREVEVFDIRALHTSIPNIIFKSIDITSEQLPSEFYEGDGYCDSLSSLHVIEHFGLGRYGDRIDPEASIVGLRNMSKLLKPGGTLYLSTPIGIERIEFNANRVFSVRKLISQLENNGLRLENLKSIRNNKSPTNVNFTDPKALQSIDEQPYTLGLFIFRKI